jgi:hypothetical protein
VIAVVRSRANLWRQDGERKAIDNWPLAMVRGGRLGDPRRVRARFMARPELKADLDALVKLEAVLCVLSVTITSADDVIVLEVIGPSEAQTLIAELFGGRAATIAAPVIRSHG